MLEVYEAHGLSKEEYEAIQASLERDPNETELSLYSAMWSEHCSYKSSKHLLKGLPTTGDYVVQGPGENAGVVKIGDTEVAFKMESHNHPSFVSPYDGAATGVGGILRDIIVMGARPVALLDSLFFSKDSKRIFEGVVSGIAGYGNCVGVPTVGGSVYFDDSYALNPLVNVMAIGVVGPKGIFKSGASGPRNPVLAFGCPTGRDGIHGASFASQEFDDEAMANRPAVQIGDPFMGKLLLEACQELFAIEGLVAIQDMGAAGFVCASSEMASKGGVGIHLDLDQIPLRERGLSASDMMLSETQERMMVVLDPEAVEAAEAIFRKWQIPHARVGEVTESGRLQLKQGGETVAAVIAQHLTDGCPSQIRPVQKPPFAVEVNKEFVIPPMPKPPEEVLLDMMSGHSLCNRSSIYEQYDHMVGADTVGRPGDADASVIRIRDSDMWIAATTDCQPRISFANPVSGVLASVGEAIRNLACVGAEPVGITDCLNFANPEDPAVQWQFAKSIEGLSLACKYFGVPVVGGNVSLYNQTGDSKILPTPVIGMVGALPPIRPVGLSFKKEDDLVYLVGGVDTTQSATRSVSLYCSEYLSAVHQLTGGPAVNASGLEIRVADVIRQLVRLGALQSVHDVSDGGVAVALAECSLAGGIGFRGSLDRQRYGSQLSEERLDARMFGEGPARYVVSILPERRSGFENALGNLPFTQIGRVTRKKSFELDGILAIEIDRLNEAWMRGFDA